ncbi:transcriptional regulator, partial [Micromonospora azadirachtae]
MTVIDNLRHGQPGGPPRRRGLGEAKTAVSRAAAPGDTADSRNQRSAGGAAVAADPSVPLTGTRPGADVSLHLLGGFQLLHGDTPVVVPRGLQRVIALIGLRPGATRCQLAGLLWPDA